MNRCSFLLDFFQELYIYQSTEGNISLSSMSCTGLIKVEPNFVQGRTKSKSKSRRWNLCVIFVHLSSDSNGIHLIKFSNKFQIIAYDPTSSSLLSLNKELPLAGTATLQQEVKALAGSKNFSLTNPPMIP